MHNITRVRLKMAVCKYPIGTNDFKKSSDDLRS